jgi:hypothetical protein
MAEQFSLMRGSAPCDNALAMSFHGKYPTRFASTPRRAPLAERATNRDVIATSGGTAAAGPGARRVHPAIYAFNPTENPVNV